jgi:hypothetical protein
MKEQEDLEVLVECQDLLKDILEQMKKIPNSKKYLAIISRSKKCTQKISMINNYAKVILKNMEMIRNLEKAFEKEPTEIPEIFETHNKDEVGINQNKAGINDALTDIEKAMETVSCNIRFFFSIIAYSVKLKPGTSFNFFVGSKEGIQFIRPIYKIKKYVEAIKKWTIKMRFQKRATKIPVDK